MREILEKLRELPASVLEEAFGAVGANYRTVEPLVRADRVYQLQFHSYLHGLFMGMLTGTIFAGFMFLSRDLEGAHYRNKQMAERIEQQRQQLIAERERPVLATQDK
jgi:hypothetical protein